MNKPQSEGKVNHVCTVERRRRSSTLFSNKKTKQRSTIVSLSKVIFACMVELDHQRSAANTLVTFSCSSVVENVRCSAILPYFLISSWRYFYRPRSKIVIPLITGIHSLHLQYT